MAKKSNKSAPSTSSMQDLNNQEETAKLQAVVLTDSYQTRFLPLTYDKPRCLMTLCNKPLLFYTLEFLKQAKVDEVILVCGIHLKQIENYIHNEYDWLPFKVTLINSVESRSIGDCMRDIDNRGIISSDFILVIGDLVSNLDFQRAYEFHLEKKKSDRDYISTMCLGTCKDPLDKLRGKETATFMIEDDNQRCLYYHENKRSGNPNEKNYSIDIDPDLFDDIALDLDADFTLRNDLIDCRVDICTAAVPAIFQENFDYQSLRSDFTKGVLASDLLKKHIYAYISDTEYCSRVESWQTYDTVSQDLINRNIYPLTIENLSDYSFGMPNIYKDENNLSLAQSCIIGKNSVIGKNTKIGSNTVIQNSVIGENCSVGDNCIIKNSYIWDNNTILDNTKVLHTLVADNCKISGSLIDCIVKKNVKIDKKQFSGVRLLHSGSVQKAYDSDSGSDDGWESDESSSGYENVDDEDSFAMSSDVASSDGEDNDDKISKLQTDIAVNELQKKIKKSTIVLKHDDKGIFKLDEPDVNSLQYQLEMAVMSDDSIISTSKRRKRTQQKKTSSKKKKNRSLSSTSYYTDDGETDGITDFSEGYSEYDEDEEEEEEDFLTEGIATMDRALENNHDLDTALLELNTLRMSMNVTYNDVRLAICTSIFKRIQNFVKTGTLPAKQATIKVFTTWGPLIKRVTFDREDYHDIFNCIEKCILGQGFDVETGSSIAFVAFNTLYNSDVIEEEHALLWWYKNLDDDKRKADINVMVAKWIEWLEQEDSEDDE